MENEEGEEDERKVGEYSMEKEGYGLYIVNKRMPSNEV